MRGETRPTCSRQPSSHRRVCCRRHPGMAVGLLGRKQRGLSSHFSYPTETLLYQSRAATTCELGHTQISCHLAIIRDSPGDHRPLEPFGGPTDSLGRIQPSIVPRSCTTSWREPSCPRAAPRRLGCGRLRPGSVPRARSRRGRRPRQWNQLRSGRFSHPDRRGYAIGRGRAMAVIRIGLATVTALSLVGASTLAESAISAELAKKCREMAIKAHPPVPAGSRTGNERAQRDYFQQCVARNGDMPK